MELFTKTTMSPLETILLYKFTKLERLFADTDRRTIYTATV